MTAGGCFLHFFWNWCAVRLTGTKRPVPRLQPLGGGASEPECGLRRKETANYEPPENLASGTALFSGAMKQPAPVLLTLSTIMFKVVSALDSRMPIKKIQVGQVWKKEDSGDSYLVTKVYNEALATFAVLRKTGSETDAPLRVKVGHAGASPTLPGFRFAQESEEF